MILYAEAIQTTEHKARTKVERIEALIKKSPMLSLIRPLVFQVLRLSLKFKVTCATLMVKRNVYMFILIGSEYQSHMVIFFESRKINPKIKFELVDLNCHANNHI